MPCFDEEQTLPLVLAELARTGDGFDVVEWLIIDDRSRDRTIAVARAGGVNHIIRLTNNDAPDSTAPWPRPRPSSSRRPC